MAELAVTAVGADRPGIIARVTAVLAEHGANLLDSSMTVLGGHFAIMLLAEAEGEASALEAELTRATEDLGLVIAVREVGGGATTGPPTHVLSVYGSDRRGLVHAVTAALAEARVNVTDLSTTVLEGAGAVYAMVFEVALPEGVEADPLVTAIGRAVEGVDVSITPLDIGTF